MKHQFARGGDGTECVPGCAACCYDLLLLVTDRRVSQRMVRLWSAAERDAASEWAAAEYANAANPSVRRKPMPDHVRRALESAHPHPALRLGAPSKPEGTE